MEDVAARAGVSRALVSIVFRDLPGASPQTRERVRAAAADIGYRPDHRARLLSRRETRLLGVTFGVGHEFHNDLVIELYAAAAAAGYELVLSGITPGRSEAQAVQELMSLRCDGLILLGPTLKTSDLDAVGRLTPTVCVARSVSADVDSVRTDDRAGAGLAVRHLLELGHTRIVHIDGRRAPGAAERRRGYQRAMLAAGLENLIALQPGGLTEEHGRDAAEQILGLPESARPTAAFVFNDQCAAGYLDAIRRAGIRVPDDHSVVGFDNSRIARSLWTQLTTIGQNTSELSRCAVDQAVSHIQGTPVAKPVLIAPELVVRHSTSTPIRPGLGNIRQSLEQIRESFETDDLAFDDAKDGQAMEGHPLPRRGEAQ
jgi:DNA-binding LacI/PurR family transcriptional regulator